MIQRISKSCSSQAAQSLRHLFSLGSFLFFQSYVILFLAQEFDDQNENKKSEKLWPKTRWKQQRCNQIVREYIKKISIRSIAILAWKIRLQNGSSTFFHAVRARSQFALDSSKSTIPIKNIIGNVILPEDWLQFSPSEANETRYVRGRFIRYDLVIVGHLFCLPVVSLPSTI